MGQRSFMVLYTIYDKTWLIRNSRDQKMFFRIMNELCFQHLFKKSAKINLVKKIGIGLNGAMCGCLSRSHCHKLPIYVV
jgi:hypothetical protein